MKVLSDMDGSPRHSTARTAGNSDSPRRSTAWVSDKNDSTNVITSQSAAAPPSDFITVQLELLSNWDHPELIGLTEIELIDGCGRGVIVYWSSDVECSVTDSANNYSVLFNGKTKVCI